jgi:hypothetical protein
MVEIIGAARDGIIKFIISIPSYALATIPEIQQNGRRRSCREQKRNALCPGLLIPG